MEKLKKAHHRFCVHRHTFPCRISINRNPPPISTVKVAFDARAERGFELKQQLSFYAMTNQVESMLAAI